MPSNLGNIIKPLNLWDLISDRFNTYKSIDSIHPDAAVNIYLGWPVFFEQIKYQTEFMGKSACNILDFGCGTGEFCNKLHMMGHYVVGVDTSEEMVKVARQNSLKEVHYFINEFSEDKTKKEEFINKIDIITSIHAFEWNEDVAKIIHELSEFLVKDGLFIFAVFPKGHVIESLKIGDLFEDFDSNEDHHKGVCNFDGVKIPVFIRDSKYFDELFAKASYDKVLEYYPPFPAAFLKKYNWHGAKYPEMMILAYRKK